MRFALLLLAALAAPALAAAPPAVEQAVRARAAEADFRGAILIGEADGTETSFTLGTPAFDRRATWRWASITKQFAATIAMQEVAARRLDLDAPVTRYWPDWRAPNAGRIRIRDLLRHNSGLPQPDDSAPDADGIPAFYRGKAVSPADAAAGFCAGPSRADPPAGFAYNNCDTLVLAEVLHKVTGKPFETLLIERLYRPLKMRGSGLFRFGKAPRRHVQPTGEFAREDALLNLGTYGASGGAWGPIQDLWRFDHALLKGALLPDAARETMWTASADNGFHGFHQWIYTAPLKGCGKPVRIVERQGLIGGIELRNYLFPESGRGLILFSHHRPTNLGDPWEGKGLAFDLTSAVACRA